MTEIQRGLTVEQIAILAKPINGTRIANRTQGGKTLSYLEAWDVKAHLIRVFGYGNFDSEVEDYGFITAREYLGGSNNDKEMVEVVWHARVRLTVRDRHGIPLCTYSEVAVGSASGPRSMLGEHHDNAVKTAESDALKRCAINLGNQFGLSLYDNGNRKDVVKGTALDPREEERLTPEKEQNLAHSVGASSNQINTPEATAEKIAEIKGDTPDPGGDEETSGSSIAHDRTPNVPTEEPPAEPEETGVLLNTSSKLAKAMYATIRDAKVAADDRIPEIVAIIGREIESTKEMTEAEASKVIDFYKQQDQS